MRVKGLQFACSKSPVLKYGLLLLLTCCSPRWSLCQGLTVVSDGAYSLSRESFSYERADKAEAIRSAAVPTKKQFRVHLFSTVAIASKVNSLGPGIDLATPLSRSFNLRGGVNLINFSYNFNIDGVNYYSGVHLHSGQLSLDWFPRHKSFHISPGLLYARNDLSGLTGVPAGQYFELGSQGFINSIDDPMNGTASIISPHKFAPSLTIGFGNMIPRNGRHLSFPIEFGVAYTGAPRINFTLDGTACTQEGCFAFSQNQEAKASLQKEVNDLNETLKRFPVYPIISSGIAYRF